MKHHGMKYEDTLTVNGKKIEITLVESLNQDNKFTSKHTRFDGKLRVSDERSAHTFFFPYQCNLAYTEPMAADILECLISDANSYESCRNIDDFAEEFGYEKVSEVIKAYDSCKATYESLQEMFTREDFDKLDELINGDELTQGDSMEFI